MKYKLVSFFKVLFMAPENSPIEFLTWNSIKILACQSQIFIFKTSEKSNVFSHNINLIEEKLIKLIKIKIST